MRYPWKAPARAFILSGQYALALLAMLGPVSLLPFASANAQVAGGLGTAPPPSQSPADRVRTALAGAGITACAPAIERAARFLFEDGDGNFTIQPLAPDVNRWPVVLTMESRHAGEGGTRLSVVTIAPAGSCSGSYEQIISWSKSCDAVKSGVFADFKSERVLYQGVRQSELTPGIQLYLMPAGNGCVSVKKELIG
ncbi:MAG: hypothetical protein ACK5NN_10235 [Sphingomonadaceae bacterium]